jgi:protein involved in polysaccharide export with SLBB domain
MNGPRTSLRRVLAGPATGRLLLSATLLVGPSLLSGVASAQERDLGAYRVDASRETLEQALARYQSFAGSPGYSQVLRARARREAAFVRTRLQEGDFRVGDRIVLMVEGEEALTDTFVVTPDRTLQLPEIGQLRLDGVLRSELNEYLTTQIAAFIVEPVVRANSFLRVSVSGSIGQPGYHLFPADMPLSEALMAVGGPSAEANLSKVRVMREDQTVLGGSSLQSALQHGATLAQLRLRSGDEVVVPKRSAFAPGEIGRTAAIISTFIFALSRII